MRSFFITCIFLSISFICLSQKKEMAPAELTQQLKASSSDTGQVRVLIVLSTYYILKPGEEKADLDSALYYLRQAEQKCNAIKLDIWTARLDFTYSRLLREKGDTAKGREYAKQAIALFSKYPEKEEHANSIMELAYYYSPDNKQGLVECISLVKQAIVLYEEAGAKEKLARQLNELGEIYNFNHDNFNAIPVLEKSLSIYQSINFKPLYVLYSLLGICYSEMGAYDRAIKYGLMALSGAEAAGDTSALIDIYNRLSLCYFNAKRYNEAITYVDKELLFFIAKRDTATIIRISLTKVKYLANLNEPERCVALIKNLEKNYFRYQALNTNKGTTIAAISNAYIYLKQYELAKPYSDRLLVLEKLYGSQVYIYSNLIDYNMGQKQYEKVYEYCDMFEKFCINGGLQSMLYSVYLSRFRADSASGKYLAAIQQFQLYKGAENSILNDKNNQQINLLNVQYETEKKEKNILFLTSNSKLQENALAKTATTRNVILGAFFFMVIIAGLLYNQQRINKKANLVISQKNEALNILVQEKELLMKEIHHRVKNNLQTIISLLESQSTYLKDDALDAMKNSQNRVQAMSIIHQKLYQTENVTAVDMSQYLPELMEYLRYSFNPGKQISFHSDIDAIKLDVTQAMPLGLIINEGITNCLKYAFPDGKNGIISIALKNIPDNYILLSMSDNGVGLPFDFDINKISSLGMSLMKGLTEEINGAFTINNNLGTTINIKFNNYLFRHSSKLVRSSNKKPSYA